MHNDLDLRKEYNLSETDIQTDSYIAVQLLENVSELNEKSVAETAEKIEGSFVFTILDGKNNSYFVRGENPLALYHYADYGFYIYASTDQILQSALKKFGLFKYRFLKVDSDIGDIIHINNCGNLSRSRFDVSRLFEPIYGCRYPQLWYDDIDYELLKIRQIKEFANTVGISPDDIDLLGIRLRKSRIYYTTRNRSKPHCNA